VGGTAAPALGALGRVRGEPRHLNDRSDQSGQACPAGGDLPRVVEDRQFPALRKRDSRERPSHEDKREPPPGEFLPLEGQSVGDDRHQSEEEKQAHLVPLAQ